MFCPKCGNVIDDDSKFCGGCGATLSSEQPVKQAYQEPMQQSYQQPIQQPYTQPVQSKKPPKQKKKIKKAPIILGLIVIGLIASGIYGFIWYSDSDISEFNEMIEDAEYEEAAELYNDDIADSWLMKMIVDGKISDLIDSTLEDFNLNTVSYDDASKIFAGFSLLDDDDLAAKASTNSDTIEKINTSKELVEDAEAEYESGDYLEAINLYEEVEEDSADYEVAVAKIDEAKAKYKEEILSETASNEILSDYEDNIALINIALGVLTDDADLLARKTELQDAYSALVKSNALEDITDLVSDGEYEDAIDLLNETLEVLSDDVDLINLYDSTIQSYKDYVNETVEDYTDSGKYNLAISFLESAVKVLPDDTELSDLLEETVESKPIELNTMTITQSSAVSSIESGSTLTDTIGSVYYGPNLYKIEDCGYMKLYLGGEYDTLSFDVSICNSSYADYTASLSIVDEDGTLLYDKASISITTLAEYVEVDVSGVEWLTIQLSDNGDTSYRHTYVIFSNPLFYK